MNQVSRWMKRCLLPAILLIAASHSGYSLASDCTAATSNIDRAACSDFPSQDGKLNEDYGEAITRLSPEGQSDLRADQRAWLRYSETACGFAEVGKSSGDVRCLSALTRRRDDRLLWLVANQDRPSLFTYFFRSSYQTTPDPSGGLPFWSESSIPQIDSKSLSPNLAWSDMQAWNTLIAKLIGGPAKSSVCPGGKGDIYREPHIYIASILLITVSEHRDDTCRGLRPNLVIVHGQGPLNDMLQDHFMSETQYNIVMMRDDVHLLQASDLFSAGDAWKRLLSERVQQEVQKQALDHRENWHPSEDAIERVATDPSNWLPANTFSIRVNQSALSANEMIGGFTVQIPWSDLQRVLSFKGKRILTAPNW